MKKKNLMKRVRSSFVAFVILFFFGASSLLASEEISTVFVKSISTSSIQIEDYSWMMGQWQYRSDIGVTNIYISVSRIKIYTTLYYNGRPTLDYNGPYTIKDDEGEYRKSGRPMKGWKVLEYGSRGYITYISIDPTQRLLYAEEGRPFRKVS